MYYKDIECIIIINFTRFINSNIFRGNCYNGNGYNDDAQIISDNPKEALIFDILTFKETKNLTYLNLERCIDKLGHIAKIVFSEARYDFLIKKMTEKYLILNNEEKKLIASRKILGILDYLNILKHELTMNLNEFFKKKSNTREVNKLRNFIIMSDLYL